MIATVGFDVVIRNLAPILARSITDYGTFPAQVHDNMSDPKTEAPPAAPEPVSWQGAVPVSDRFADPYYSLQDGLAETGHVFLAGNDLPGRFRDGFHIGELGFGTGLNALATLAAWERAGIAGRFEFTSFEAFPISHRDMAQAHIAWPELAPHAETLAAAWATGAREITLGPMRVRVIIGDVGQTLPDWRGPVDAWFLDGFSPARNPAMWTDEILAAIGRATRPGGTIATYTAASRVRAGLARAGFSVTRCKGFAHKRHMTRGVK